LEGADLQESTGKHFDRDLAIESRIARAIHLAHAAGANGRDDFVVTELGPGCQRHVGSRAIISALPGLPVQAKETSLKGSMLICPL
jgi:hypothetical protein